MLTVMRRYSKAKLLLNTKVQVDVNIKMQVQLGQDALSTKAQVDVKSKKHVK